MRQQHGMTSHTSEVEKLWFRDATKDDMRDLLEWRNHPDARSASFNSASIGWEDHERWFARKLSDPNATLYLALLGESKVGTIRYEGKPTGVFVSIVVNPDFWGQGLGTKIITYGTQKFIREKKPDKPILAEIKVDNQASLKAFQKAGFHESYVTYVLNPNESYLRTGEQPCSPKTEET